MSDSGIDYVQKSINPIVGCTKCSPGCLHCWAEQMAKRLKGMGQGKYDSVVDANGWTGQVALDLSQFDTLPKQKPCRVAINFMGDMFHGNVPSPWLDRVYDEMRARPHCTFLILTKRAERMAVYSRGRAAVAPNIWHLVTCENQRMADLRVPWLLSMASAVRGVSLEPLLGPVHLDCLFSQRHIDWVVAGCESGPGRRPCKWEWLRDLRDQCKAARVPFYLKQMEVDGRVCHDVARFPPELQIREFPR